MAADMNLIKIIQRVFKKVHVEMHHFDLYLFHIFHSILNDFHARLL